MNPARRAPWIVAGCILAALAAVLSYPGTLGFSKILEIQGASGESHLLKATVPENLPRIRGRAVVPPEQPRVFENGKALPHPGSSEKHIRNGGFGRYGIQGRTIFYSTRDGEPAVGRIFSVQWPLWSLPEGVLLIPWIASLLAFAVAFRNAHGFSDKTENLLQIGTTVCLFLACVFWPGGIFREFFDGLAIPLLWALLLATWVRKPGFYAALIASILALLPVFAAAFVYLVEARSHSSMLVAGILPRSDAWVHFRQAIDIAATGGTDVFFNGRILFPAFLSSFLALTGANLSLSSLLVAGLVLLACALAAAFVSRKAGVFPAATLCLCVWLYYRHDGCGQVMTENFGLLAGLLALPFLIAGWSRGSVLLFSIAIFLFGMGFSARPGALFLLPGLVLAAAFLPCQKNKPWFRRAFPKVLLAGLLGFAGLLSNSLPASKLLRAEGVAFGNFAFSLHGLLHGTNWFESYSKYQADSKRIMAINLETMRKDPMSLARGISRAFGETFGKRFLFRFGSERRLAALGMIGFCAAVLGVWFFKDWRPQAPWILGSVLGILASIPFAPPWDAGLRPYAVTVPLQALLAGLGWIFIWRLLRLGLDKIPGGTTCDSANQEAASPSILGPVVFASVVCFLTFAGPFFLRVQLPNSSTAFLPGTYLVVSETPERFPGAVSKTKFREGLAELLASNPDAGGELLTEADTFKVGIQSSELEVAVIPWPWE